MEEKVKANCKVWGLSKRGWSSIEMGSLDESSLGGNEEPTLGCVRIEMPITFQMEIGGKDVVCKPGC